MSATPNATSFSASCKIFIALIIRADDWAGRWFLGVLNRSINAMQFLSLYNLGAPVLSLLLPVFLLILPYFILKVQAKKITFEEYIKLLKVVYSQNSIFKMFTEFGTASLNQKFYLIILFIFYIVQIYNNVMACINFYKNINNITLFIKEMKQYLFECFPVFDELTSYTSKLKEYKLFHQDILDHKNVLQKMYNKLNNVINTKFTMIKVGQIGIIMKHYYELFNDEIYNKSMCFSFGLHGYLENIIELKNKLGCKKLGLCKYTNKKTKFKNAYYATLINKNPVKNSYSISKNKIITGPNAAGKTTILKTTLFNLICSQQFGLGFYSSAKVNPFDYLHCYLNIL